MSDKYRGYYDRDLEDEFYRGDRGDHELLNELDQREYVVDGDELLTKEQASEREYERDQEEKERRKREKEEHEKWNDPYFDKDIYESNEEGSGSSAFGVLVGFLFGLGVLVGIGYIVLSGIQM